MSSVPDPSAPATPPPALQTDAVMAGVRARVREDLEARLRAAGTPEADARALVLELERLFLEATMVDDPARLALPSLLADPWRPELALRFTSHRPGWIGALVVGFKRRVLLPLNRWLFEYTLANFRRQDRFNLVLLACLERLAAENVRLRRELDARGTAATAAAADAASPRA